MKRLRCWVTGRVQGVFFRGATQERMRELGVRGWVRNLPDGRVEALVEGDDAALEQALAFLRRGPRGALVTGVEVADASAGETLGAFEIRR
ncbi:MAG TPA: acylphosphatase [Myxococcota bacterium]|nr:acylphosphatase [Myxococcota bacterium]